MSEPWVAIAVAAALLYLPGTALLSVLRCAVPFRFGLAPAASAGILALLGFAFAPFGIRWELPWVVLGVLVILGVAAVCGRVLVRRGLAGERPRHGPPGVGPLALTVAGALASAAVLVVPIVRAGLRLDSRINAFDAVFHLNAVAFVRADGMATPWTALAGMYGGERPFYPVSLHLVAALVPGDVVTAMNATLLIVLCSTGFTLASLLWAVTPAVLPPLWRASVIALCLPMSTLFLSIPTMVLPMGLWPNALAAVVLPAVVAAALHGVRVLDRILRRPTWRARAGHLLELLPEAVVIGGGILIHPSLTFSLAALSLALLIVHALVLARRAPRRALALGALIVAACIAYDIVGMTVLRGMALTTKPFMDPLSTLLTLLSDRPRLSAVPLKTQYVLGVYPLAVIGAVSAVRSRSRVRLGLVAFAVVVSVLALSTANSWVPLASLTNPWYQARERVLPLLTCTVVALAAIGALRLVEEVRERRPRWAVPLVLVLAVSVAVPAAGTALDPNRLPRVVQLTGAAGGDYFAQYLTDAEDRFIVESASRLPEDAVVLGDPADGTAYYWALGRRRVAFPHLGRPGTPALRDIALNAEDMGSNAHVCSLMAAQGDELYLYADRSATRAGGRLGPPASEYYSGLDGISAEHLELVDSAGDGDFVLYRVTPPC